MEDFNQARGFIERALAAAPEAPILNYHMGMVLVEKDKPEAARIKLEKALEGDQNFYGRAVAEETLIKLKASSSANS
jgi:tetratricopeptide (TPR) repeat protein